MVWSNYDYGNSNLSWLTLMQSPVHDTGFSSSFIMQSWYASLL